MVAGLKLRGQLRIIHDPRRRPCLVPRLRSPVVAAISCLRRSDLDRDYSQHLYVSLDPALQQAHVRPSSCDHDLDNDRAVRHG